MELVVFDLDGTLLNGESVITDYTRDTLAMLADKGVAYTVATGRTLHASRELLSGHGFDLPQVYKNGVVIWHPEAARFTHRNVLTPDELAHVAQACLDSEIAPFVFTLEGHDGHAVYHAPLHSDAEKELKGLYLDGRGLPVHPISALPGNADISNISAIGPQDRIERIAAFVADEDHLVAYSGPAFEGNNLYWIDVHHSDASKGGAVDILRDMLEVKRVICFGDSDNDLSMFASADESYAPANAKPRVRSAATAVIGHHDEEGIAHFLRQRFGLASG
ncbi:MAG: HAD-IIB family hydrolase [Xanthomonadales bacterium]|nr:HAD-IIB family hydrolase [Xanthomonadales bacterium]